MSGWIIAADMSRVISLPDDVPAPFDTEEAALDELIRRLVSQRQATADYIKSARRRLEAIHRKSNRGRGG